MLATTTMERSAVGSPVAVAGEDAMAESVTFTPDTDLGSVLGESFAATPSIVPLRGHLDAIKHLTKGDRHIGRGSRQRGLLRDRFANPFKVAQCGGEQAIALFTPTLKSDISAHVSIVDIVRGAPRVPPCCETELPRRRVGSSLSGAVAICL